ncbi:MAG: hypothetical protein JO157_02495, partial [Acetobacteraceae bacterium]|nr:hypothetical protein [Acetobacteraceae bacterium]
MARLDRLVTELLAMTQRTRPVPRRVQLSAFLAEHAAQLEAAATERGVRIAVAASGEAWLDPAVIGRVLDN